MYGPLKQPKATLHICCEFFTCVFEYRGKGIEKLTILMAHLDLYPQIKLFIEFASSNHLIFWYCEEIKK